MTEKQYNRVIEIDEILTVLSIIDQLDDSACPLNIEFREEKMIVACGPTIEDALMVKRFKDAILKTSMEIEMELTDEIDKL